MNRFVVSRGAFVGTRGSGSILLRDNTASMSFAYDAAGERIRMGQLFSHQIYDGDAHKYENVTSETDELYTYTADGLLAQVNTVKGSDSYYYDDEAEVTPAAPSGTGTVAALYNYDTKGRVVDYQEKNTTGTVVYTRDSTFNTKSEVTQDVVTTVRSDGTFVSTTTYDYLAGVTSGGTTTYTGAYQGGEVTHSHSVTTKNGSSQPTTDTIDSYAWFDSAVQSNIDFNPDTSHSTVNHSVYTYNPQGQLTSVAITDGRPRTVSFILDVNGQVLQRSEADSLSTGDPMEMHFYFNGIPIGDVSNNGTSDVDYAQSIAQHIAVPGTGPFQGGSPTYIEHADFDQSYDPVNGLNYENAPSQYTVASGDTLETIAQQLWGDSSFWYMIADANGLSGDSDLVAGMDLIIPNKIHNTDNNATTYRPYDPNEALGDTSPTAPKQPKHHHDCGIAGQIIMAVVAIAVAALLPVALPGIFGTSGILGGGIIADAAAAGVGDLVGQGVGLAIGAESKLNWKEVAESALSAGVGAGVGEIPGLKGVGFGVTVARGVIGQAVTQGIEVATGLEKKFDWAGVAAAGVGAAVSWGVGGMIQNAHFASNSVMNQAIKRFVSGMAGDLAGAATRTLVDGSDFGDNILKALPSALGQLFGDIVGGDIEEGRLESEMSAQYPTMSPTDISAFAQVKASGGDMTSMLEALGVEGGSLPVAAQNMPQVYAARDRLLSELGQMNPNSDDTKSLRNIVDGALVAMDSYNNSPDMRLLPPGFRRLGDDDLNRLGVKPALLNRLNSSGYFGALYWDPDIKGYMMGDRGTMGFDDQKAWASSFLQYLGKPSPEYIDAVAAGRAVSNAVGDMPLIFVGHSLGGGLAIAQAIATNRRAIVFDSAGVRYATMANSGVNMSQSTFTDRLDNNVSAVSVDGDILTNVQQQLARKLIAMATVVDTGVEATDMSVSPGMVGRYTVGGLLQMAGVSGNVQAMIPASIEQMTDVQFVVALQGAPSAPTDVVPVERSRVIPGVTVDNNGAYSLMPPLPNDLLSFKDTVPERLYDHHLSTTLFSLDYLLNTQLQYRQKPY